MKIIIAAQLLYYGFNGIVLLSASLKPQHMKIVNNNAECRMQNAEI